MLFVFLLPFNASFQDNMALISNDWIILSRITKYLAKAFIPQVTV